MKKNLINFIKKNITLSVVILTLIIGVPVLGAIVMDKSTFEHGIEILEEGLDVYGGDVDITVDTNLSGTTTIPWMDASLHAPMTWTTSTYGFDGVDDPTVNVKVRNTGADLLCTDVWLDVSTAVTTLGGSYTVGTTTISNDDSLTNTSTATLITETAITTSTADILNKEDDVGSNTNEVWVWTHNDYMVVSMAGAGGMVSSTDALAVGGFTGVGTLNVNCRTRY